MMQIKNNDNLCCPRAIIMALTYHTDTIFGTKRNIAHIREGRKIQTKLAEELCKRLGDYNEEGFTLKDIKNVEELLKIQVKVVLQKVLTQSFIPEKIKKSKLIYIKMATTLTPLMV
jgi:hypothetical protein